MVEKLYLYLLVPTVLLVVKNDFCSDNLKNVLINVI